MNKIIVLCLLALCALVISDMCSHIFINCQAINNETSHRLNNAPLSENANNQEKILPSYPKATLPNLTDGNNGEILIGNDIKKEIKSRGSLLSCIRQEAPLIEVLPLDIVIDRIQVENPELIKTNISVITSFNDSNAKIIPSNKNAEEERINLTNVNEERLPDDIIIKRLQCDVSDLSRFIEKRYDITYERFVPFYRFYLSALLSSAHEITECFEVFDSLSVREKALALIALYIFEQRARNPKPINKYKYKDRILKYSSIKEDDPFSEEEWGELISRINQLCYDENIAFDPVSNEGLIEEWEYNLRINALLYQCRLANCNPYFQRQDLNSFWIDLCIFAPIDFIFALLVSETDESFLTSSKSFPKRNTCDMFRIILMTRERMKANLKSMKNEEDNDSISSLTTNELSNSTILPIIRDRINEPLSTSFSILLMREYLKTQYSYSKNFILMNNGISSSYDVVTSSILTPPATPYYVNTSSESITLGFIASMLLHARGLFDETE